MINLSKILVTHDFSPCSNQVLDYGIELAIETRAELYFLYVDVVDDVLSDDSDKKEHHPDALELREKLRKEIYASARKQGFDPSDIEAIQYTVRKDISAAPSITKYCKEKEIDLVLIGTHGRRGMVRRWLGSIAEEVVRTAPCPVLTLRERVEPKSLADTLQKITVPVDFSSDSEDALQYAKSLAAFYEARLEVLHVIEHQVMPSFYDPTTYPAETLEVDHLKNKLIEHMQALYSSAKGADVEVDFTVLHGHPVGEIVKWTADNNTDLIVIASHGLTANRTSGMGSVAERIVRMADCPVFTVKSSEALARLSTGSEHERMNA